MCYNYPSWNLIGTSASDIIIIIIMLTWSTELQNMSFHVVERTKTSSKCTKMKNECAKHTKILFLVVKCANVWVFCCCRCRGCYKHPISKIHLHHRKKLAMHGPMKKWFRSPHYWPRSRPCWFSVSTVDFHSL